MAHSKKQSGAWVFVSHSHRDLEKVREVRNYLERGGHNPLLFFLKCLADDDARLPQLIRDEISARNWFVLCDSLNARTSRYVPEEIALVESVEGKSRETIDLDRDLEPQLYKLDRLLKRATVFLSYARTDSQVAMRIRHALQSHDYAVWSDMGLSAGDDWESAIRSAIDEAAGKGFVLLLLSPASLETEYCKAEAEYALGIAARSPRSNVIPVLIAPFAKDLVPAQHDNIYWFDLTTGSFEERIESLIRNLKIRDME